MELYLLESSNNYGYNAIFINEVTFINVMNLHLLESYIS